ncbi:head GIN domain-containing protein [Sphingopyxis panaciterrulae]|uniref:Putative auto-transporter adhesin head GIN domain-containing protein n=1 Tax=Sphingopyxis panaciterrulae TaxID=462372 RepID=A0A7W9B6K2_9SPHN|nr:head GIN domain-containing protein [Sphingopyxis panaciterrulae]MBB5707147.1 hypothetical protein [Sphingopyxis panaciterrulae]
MTHLSRWAALAAAALFCTCTANAAEKRYGLTSFESIEVDADVTVEVSARAPVSAVASGSQDALDRLLVEARDGKLVIKMRRFAGDGEKGKGAAPVVVRVNAAGLASAMLAGAGSLAIDRLRGARVAIGLRGPGRLTVAHVEADRLEVAMIGNGTMTLGGEAKQASLLLSGAGAVDAGKLAVGDLKSDSEGAGDHLFNATKSATITARGVGRTVVLGRPVCTVRNVGSGTVDCGAGGGR